MDCLDGLRLLDNDCIDLTVTSPPYDNLRTYNGYSFDFDNIGKELYRVTKKGGVVVWIVNDATINGSETGTSFRQALYFKEIGFNLHDTMIYKKNNYMPLNLNRYDNQFEYMFVLSKGKPKTFNPIMTSCKYSGTEHNTKFRTCGSSKEKKGVLRKRDEVFTTKPEKYISNIWGYDVGKNKSSKDNIWQHPATFPEALVNDHIITWSNDKDLILDPFMGSGTTAKMAIMANRKYIGFEISEEYCDLAEKRLKPIKEQINLFEEEL